MVVYPRRCTKSDGMLTKVEESNMRYTDCINCGDVVYSEVQKAKVLDFKALKGKRLNRQNGEPKNPKPPQ